MDFTLDRQVDDWRGRIAGFIRDVVVPAEQRALEHGADDALRREQQAAARAAGVWAPQAPAELGGGGYRFDEVAVLLGAGLLGRWP